MNKVYALLGGNTGDLNSTFNQCIEKISHQVGNCVKTSNIYVSEPWGFKSNNLFYNQAVLVETHKSPEDVLKSFQNIEKELGRTTKTNNRNFVSRSIDIDILFFNDVIFKSKSLSIPHPYLHQRCFALMPMVEIAPKLIHPEFDKSIAQILANCEDISYVRSIKQHKASLILS